MSPQAWKFVDDYAFPIFIGLFFLLLAGTWVFKEILLILEPKEVKLARIEAQKQIDIERVKNRVSEEEDEE